MKIKGSVQKKNNKYWVVIDLPPNPGQKRNQKWESSYDTKEEAEKRLTEVRHQRNTGMYIEPTNITVKEFMEKWLEDVVIHSNKKSTYKRYKGLIENHIITEVGNLKLSKLQPMHLQNLYSQKLKKGNLKTGKGLSKKTVKMIHNVIHKALDRALKWKMVPVNVANAVDAPRLERKEMKYLTPEQVKIFLKFTKKDKFHVLFLTTVMTGLRRGEVLGLQWKDINLKLKRLAVSSSLVRRDNKYVLGEPKTRGSIRTLDLSQTVVNELKTHRKKQIEQKLRYGLEFNDDDFVFAREDGQPIHPNSLLRHFKKVLNDANLPEIRFHDLRHTHATLLLSQEINPKIVSERLGHTSVEITLDRYSHVLPNMQREAADSLEIAIFS